MEALKVELEEVIRSVDSIEGPVIDIGFGKGTISNILLDLMISSQITKRKFILIDSYEKGGWQQAYDFCNNVKNYLKGEASHIKQNALDVPDNIIGKVPCVIVDVGDYNLSSDIIKKYSKLVKKNGVIITITPEDADKTAMLDIFKEVNSKKSNLVAGYTITYLRAFTLKKLDDTKKPIRGKKYTD
mgnify:FL=1